MINIPFPPGALVAAYLRDSGGQFQELSLPRQESEFRRWCDQNGLIPGQVFEDEARPGSNVVGRSAFQEMMAYFRSGRAQEAGLVVWNYQRFARDIDDSQFFRADLRRRGYVIHSLNDEIPEGPMGRLFEAILDWKNEQFLIDLSIDIKSGMRHLVETYHAVPGTPPRGFKRDPVKIASHRNDQPRIVHRWIPDPDHLPNLRQAFNMLLSGSSLAEIKESTHLYTSLNSYKTFFSNPIYKGVLKYGDLVVEDYCEPVVDSLVWDRAQAIIEKRACRRHLSGDNPDHPRRTGETYILSGLAYCALCRSPMFGHSTKQRNGSYHQEYACSRRYRNRDCRSRPIPRQFLEKMVLEAIQVQLFTSENLAACQESMLHELQKSQVDLDWRLKEERSRLASIRRRISNLTEILTEQGGTSRALLSKLAVLESEETEILASLAHLEAQYQQNFEPLSSSDIETWIQQITAALQTAPPSTLHRILRALIHRINLERTDDSIIAQILYYFPSSIPQTINPTMSLSQDPLGVPPHRHCFSLQFAFPFRKRLHLLSTAPFLKTNSAPSVGEVCYRPVPDEVSELDGEFS